MEIREVPLPHIQTRLARTLLLSSILFVFLRLLDVPLLLLLRPGLAPQPHHSPRPDREHQVGGGV